MILIFEGLDGTGKTTIAKELSKVLQIPYFKNPTEKKYFYSDVSKYRYLDQLYIAEFLKQTSYSIIFDRCYPSDIVYTSVFRFNNNNILPILYDIDSKFSEMKAKIVFCDKKKLRKDDIIDIEKFKNEIKNEYNLFLNKTKCSHIILDTSAENLKVQIGELLSAISSGYYKSSLVLQNK